MVFLVNEGEKLMVCDANQKPATNVDLTINGEKVDLNNFVQGFISETVIGMVRSLRGVGDIETIKLKVSKKIESPQT
jgi:hypothetical protein